jgi:hypothetical protein
MQGRERLAELGRLLWRGTLELPRALRILWLLWWRRSARAKRALAALQKALQARHQQGPATDSLLEPLEPGLFRVAPVYLGASSDAAPSGPTVLHLLGTAEVVYAPLPGLKALCEREPRLRQCRHVIADTPHEPGAFLGADEFRARLRRLVAPELARNPHGLVVFGLSRGGLVALDIGTELAQDRPGARVAVLSLGAPLRKQARVPFTVWSIGALETITDIMTRELALWPLLGPLYRAIIGAQYLRNCARVLAELEIDDPETVALYARYVSETDVCQASLRGVREFALLRRVSDAELRHAVATVVRRAANPALQVCSTMVWGERDVWVDVAPSLERAREACERGGLPESRFGLYTLASWNHAVGRSLDQDFTPLAAWLWRACEFVTARETEVALPKLEATR